MLDTRNAEILRAALENLQAGLCMVGSGPENLFLE